MKPRVIAGIVAGLFIAGINIAVFALAYSIDDDPYGYDDYGSETYRYDPPRGLPAYEPPPAFEPTPPRVPRDPPRPLTEGELALVGTWIATVDGRASRTQTAAGGVMLQLEPGQDLVTGIMDAVENDRRVETACIWLELYDDLTGFRNECALQNGEPSALDCRNPMTGESSRFGVPFEWQLGEGNTVEITLEQDLVVPRGDQPEFRTRRWNLRFGDDAESHRVITESFPDNDYELPTQYSWEIIPGAFL